MNNSNDEINEDDIHSEKEYFSIALKERIFLRKKDVNQEDSKKSSQDKKQYKKIYSKEV